MIDVVGHFGSHLSYATVASRVARALRAAELLGRVDNLDDVWLEEHADLRSWGSQHLAKDGSHAVLFADPREYLFSAYESRYGAQRVAVFASPNTTRMDRERRGVCDRAGLVIAPSRWSLDAVRARQEPEVLDRQLTLLPLGVDDAYLGLRARRQLVARATPRQMVHFSTDFSWPGRKGTEELLRAWDVARPLMEHKPELVVHLPSAIYEPAHFLAAELNILDSVELRPMPLRGSTDAQLIALYEAADWVVQPSRCEGFGMMMLAACVSATPLITTYCTGHEDFLSQFGGWIGVAVGSKLDELMGEEGKSPVVEAARIADALVAASTYSMFVRAQAGAVVTDHAERWTWTGVTPEWVETLKEWIG